MLLNEGKDDDGEDREEPIEERKYVDEIVHNLRNGKKLMITEKGIWKNLRQGNLFSTFNEMLRKSRLNIKGHIFIRVYQIVSYAEVIKILVEAEYKMELH